MVILLIVLTGLFFAGWLMFVVETEHSSSVTTGFATLLLFLPAFTMLGIIIALLRGWQP